MSTLVPSFRLPISVRGLVPDPVADAIEQHDDQLTDLSQAIPSLKSQINAMNSQMAGTTSTVNNLTTNSETTVVTPNVIGMVNDQTGETSYNTRPSDYGAFILLSDSSPIAVTLSGATAVQVPWFAWIINSGAGTATLTPEIGTINGSASLTLLGGQAVTVVYDGTNFEILPLLTIANVAGLAAALALLAPIASPTFTGPVTQPAPSVLTAATSATSATAGAATALPATPAGYVEQEINGTVFRLAYYNV